MRERGEREISNLVIQFFLLQYTPYTCICKISHQQQYNRQSANIMVSVQALKIISSKYE